MTLAGLEGHLLSTLPRIPGYNMPCMYTPHSHLPLTPPEYIQPYGSTAVRANPRPHSYAVGQSVIEKGVYEYKMVAPFPPFHHSQQTNYAGLPPPGLTHPNSFYQSNPSSGGYPQRRVELPPIIDDNYRQRRQEPKKEVSMEKVGGVAAHLDYEMDDMTDFVAAVSRGLVCGAQGSVSPHFRKFVFQILSSTRLPSSTILLGLVYLRVRIPPQGVSSSLSLEDLLDRMLTVSLLLASKFLDDNTFQNKSWSEVTGIPVLELNALEKAWLELIGWDLHIDAEGTKGFANYKAMWEAWIQRNETKTMAVPALAPINTNLHVRTSQSSFTPVPLYPPHQQYTPPHSNVMSSRAIQLPPPRPSQPPHETGYWWSPTQGSPPSAPHSGPPTPEGYYGWGSFPHQSTVPVPQTSSYSRLPPIIPHYGNTHHPWSAAQRCTCWQCHKANENFFISSYGQPITA